MLTLASLDSLSSVPNCFLSDINARRPNILLCLSPGFVWSFNLEFYVFKYRFEYWWRCTAFSHLCGRKSKGARLFSAKLNSAYVLKQYDSFFFTSPVTATYNLTMCCSVTIQDRFLFNLRGVFPTPVKLNVHVSTYCLTIDIPR